ncbi:MAG: S8 family serine peptidase [Acidobacteria bacterium]|nr:S8 family serine peptidase [Acidobacteriota bacterium]
MMNSSRRAVVVAVFFCSVLVFGQSPAPQKYILETKIGADVGSLASRYRFTIGRSWRSDNHDSYAISVGEGFGASDARVLAREPGVLEVEVDAAVRFGSETSLLGGTALERLTEQLTPRAPVGYFGSLVRASYVDQPAARIIGLPQSWSEFPTGAGVVAIIDTGVDERHPALVNVLLPGYDFTRNLAGTASELADLDQSTVAILDQSTVAILDGKVRPVKLNQSTVAILDQSTVAILDGRLPAAFGHGTMVAGLVHLTAPTARILPLKAFRADGSSNLSDIVRAIYFAVDRGAAVITMSFSFDTPSVALSDAIAYAVKRGVICVASVGNDGKEKRVYPAAFSRVIGVSSTNYSDKRSPFSNYGEDSKASAPGEAVITTFPGNHYAGVWGTSFSTPMVAGAMAIMRQINPKMDAADAADLLEHGLKVRGDMGARLQLPAFLSECLGKKR